MYIPVNIIYLETELYIHNVFLFFAISQFALFKNTTYHLFVTDKYFVAYCRRCVDRRCVGRRCMDNPCTLYSMSRRCVDRRCVGRRCMDNPCVSRRCVDRRLQKYR